MGERETERNSSPSRKHYYVCAGVGVIMPQFISADECDVRADFFSERYRLELVS